MAAAEGLPPDLVFVDLETTGGSAAYDRITEVGLVRVRDGELIEEWSSLVNPERPIPAYIEAFTGISNEMVAGAPRFAEIASAVRQKLQGAVFVAHNARFDYSFLRAEFFKSAVDFSTQVLCTVKLSRRLFPEFARHNLDAVMERHELTCGARHRALGDARVLHDFWSKLRREVDEERLAAAVRAVVGAHKLPAHLPPGLADDLPEGPGVYRLFGENGTLLYVGKGNSLRSRVCGHFAGQDALSVDGRLAIEVRRIDWVQTAGELGSMLREAQWVRAEKPVYNRRTKDTAECHTLRVAAAQIQGGPGAPVEARPVEALPVEGVDAADLAQCFGVFHSAKDARKALGDIARAKQLCLKVLGIEDSPGSCLAYQVGKCKGACVGKEPLILHNMRLQLALSSLKLKAWPFPGRIALRERSPRTGMPEWMRDTELHVLDQWAYLGTARTDEELATLGSSCSSGAFDVDVYRILVRYFAKNPKLDWVDMRGSTMCR
jgi:DNA polymerase-3 subunit epsilon